MTVSSTNRKTEPFIGDGIATEFDFEFRVFSEEDIYAVQTVTATEVETALILNTDYTVDLNDDQDTGPGGSITLTTAPPTGETLVITSILEYLQSTDITNQGGFYPEVIERALDRLAVYAQQLDEELSRSLKVSLAENMSGLLVKSLVPGQVMRFNLAGDGFDTVNFADLTADEINAVIGSPAEGHILQYDAGSAVWQNVVPAIPDLNHILLVSSDNIDYTYNFAPARSSLSAYDWLIVRMPGFACEADPTININGLEAQNIIDRAGTNLTAGTLAANQSYLLGRNLANDKWVLLTSSADGGGTSDIIVPVDMIEFNDPGLMGFVNFNDAQGLRCLDTSLIGMGEIDHILPAALTAYDLEMKIGMTTAVASKTKDIVATLYLMDVDNNRTISGSAQIKVSEPVPDDATDTFTILWEDFIGAGIITTANTRIVVTVSIDEGTSNNHSGSVVVLGLRLITQ